MTLEDIEKRFCECIKLDMNLTNFPFTKLTYKQQKQETIKLLSKRFGYVPTPIYIVDAMICMERKNLKDDSNTCDYCAGGAGQYSIRLLRYFKNKFHLSDHDILNHLKNNHVFTELQLTNCATLVYIFGSDINLFCGDSLNLKYMTNEHGIVFFNEATKKWEHDEWVDKIIQNDVIRNNKDYLTFVFNNYKDRNKLAEFLKNISKSNK